MKNFAILIFASLGLFIIASCNKDIEEPVYIPNANEWIINNDTFPTMRFDYNDTFNTLKGVSARYELALQFRFKPTESGRYVFRQSPDEHFEIGAYVKELNGTTVYHSIDDDGTSLKNEYYADVTVEGSRIKVQFTNIFLKNYFGENKIKVSANID